jgi:hypothetical protein
VLLRPASTGSRSHESARTNLSWGSPGQVLADEPPLDVPCPLEHVKANRHGYSSPSPGPPRRAKDGGQRAAVEGVSQSVECTGRELLERVGRDDVLRRHGLVGVPSREEASRTEDRPHARGRRVWRRACQRSGLARPSRRPVQRGGHQRRRPSCARRRTEPGLPGDTLRWGTTTSPLRTPCRSTCAGRRARFSEGRRIAHPGPDPSHELERPV